MMRTRATASLRRPVAAAGPEGTARGRVTVSDSVEKPAAAPGCSTGSGVAVGGVPRSSALWMVSGAVSVPVRGWSLTCVLRLAGVGPALLRDLVDLVGHRLLRLVRVVRAGVDLQLGQRLAAERVVRQHAADRPLDGLLRPLGQQLV